MKHTFSEFVGKEVHLYPQDSYKKRAILCEINKYGLLFKITYSEKGANYKVDDLVFINHSNKIELSLFNN